MGGQRLLGPAASQMPLPRTVLRHLLFAHQIGLGARVLDVGCGHGDLVHVLDDLGLEATGLDESAENVSWAKELEPRADFYIVSPSAELMWEHIGDDQPLDLIIVRHLTAYDGSLFSPLSFLATSRLLQHLCGGGSLVFLIHRETDSSEAAQTHEVACFARHLSFFPGTCRVKHFSDCELATRASDWLHGQRHHGEIVMISVQVPAEPFAALAWKQLAVEASGSSAATCCAWATRAAARAA